MGRFVLNIKLRNDATPSPGWRKQLTKVRLELAKTHAQLWWDATRNEAGEYIDYE